MEDFFVNIGIPLTYVLIGVAALGALASPIIGMVQKPQSLKGALMGIGLLVVVGGISFALGDGSNPSAIEISESGAKQVDAGLYAFYILSLVAVVATIYAEVSKLIK